MQHITVGPSVIAVVILTIPILMVIGGIVAGIVRTWGRQRLAERAARERIAAIERGLDPSQLSPMPVVDEHAQRAAAIKQLQATFTPTELQKAQGWLLAGAMTLAGGLGLMLMLMILPEASANKAWAAALLPVFVGIAAIVCSVIVRKGATANDRTPGPPTA